MTEDSFTLRDTNICKGIAILFMILHHCVGKYYNTFDISWYAENNTGGTMSLFILFLATSGKVCVSLFSILSGYGITKSYISYSKSDPALKCKDIRFIFSNLLRFYSIYAVIFIVMLLSTTTSIKELLFSFYSSNYNIKQAICFFLLDFLGISQLFPLPRLLFDWYIQAIILFYIFFPLLQLITKKLKLAAIAAAFLPTLFAACSGKDIPDHFAFYILPFVVGIYFAQNNVFDKLNKYRSVKTTVISGLLVLVVFALRLVFAIPIDCFFGLAIILFEFFALSRLKYSGEILGYLGKYSPNMWLSHVMYINILPAALPLRFLRTVTMSLLLSVGIESVKDISGFNRLIKTARKKICYSKESKA